MRPKQPRKNPRPALFRPVPVTAIVLALAVLHCVQPLQTDGGFGSETTNGMVAGKAYRENGTPEPNVRVLLLPESFNPTVDSAQKTVRADTTDAGGAFGFDGVRQGTYNILLNGGDGQTKAFINAVTVAPQKVSEAAGTLKSTGNLLVALPPEASITATVYLSGTPWLEAIDSATLANGYLVVQSLPCGRLPPVRIAGSHGDLVIADSAYVVSGDTALSGPAAHERMVFVAPDGDDSAAGTIRAPWKTIQRSANVVRPGAIVYVRKGMYREIVTMKASGTRDSLITFKAEHGATAQSPDPANCAFKFDDNSHIVLDGFEIRGGDCGVYNADGHDSLSKGCVIANCAIHGQSGNGIRFHARGITIAGTTIFDCADYAVRVRGNANGGHSLIKGNSISNSAGGITISLGFTTIAGNRISAIRGYGIDIVEGDSIAVEANTVCDVGTVHIQINATGRARNVKIAGNLLYNTAGFALNGGNQAALYVHNAPGLLIANNTVANAAVGLLLEDVALLPQTYGAVKNSIFYNNRAPHGYVGAASASMTIDYNCYFGPKQGTAADNQDTGGHSISADPMFADPARYDFRLLKESPCLNGGENGTTIGALGAQ